MIKLAICGAGGRIGRTIYKSLVGNNDFKIEFGVDFCGANDLPFPVFKSFAEANGTCDVIVDFSNASTLEDILSYALAKTTTW